MNGLKVKTILLRYLDDCCRLEFIPFSRSPPPPPLVGKDTWILAVLVSISHHLYIVPAIGQSCWACSVTFEPLMSSWVCYSHGVAAWWLWAVGEPRLPSCPLRGRSLHRSCCSLHIVVVVVVDIIGSDISWGSSSCLCCPIELPSR